MDHLQSETNSTMQPGVPVVLPSSFSGSPRSMQQNYQDAMAIVAKHGKLNGTGDKLRDRTDIDPMISAEIPDEEEDPWRAVQPREIVHDTGTRPCGVDNPNSVCMEDGTCRKKFLKEFLDETLENVNGYPAYTS